MIIHIINRIHFLIYTIQDNTFIEFSLQSKLMRKWFKKYSKIFLLFYETYETSSFMKELHFNQLINEQFNK